MAIYGFDGARCAFSYIYLSDLVPTSSIPLVGTLYYVIDGLTMGIQAMYFKWVSSYYQFYMAFIICCSFAVFGLAWAVLVESPMKLVVRGEVQRAV